MESRPDSRHEADRHIIFERFYVEHVRQFINFGLRIIPEMETVRDIVQEVFISLWDRQETVKSEEHAKSFVYTSIHNRLMNVLRSRKVVNHHALKMREQYDEGSFRDMVIESEMYEFLCRRIESLPPMQQKVIWLHAEGLSNEEIAQRLGITVNTVLTHKQRAKNTLKGYLVLLPGAAISGFLSFFFDRV